MTTNNHPAHGPVSLDRLHQISEILSKAAAQSDGGNLGYAMADAVKVIDEVLSIPVTLPCPVHLEAGLKFGKGVPTRLVLGALRRRADHYAELDAMTPEQRAEHDAGIEAIKAMLPKSAQPDIEILASVLRNAPLAPSDSQGRARAPVVNSEPVVWWTGPEPTPTGETESIHDHETGSHSIPLYPLYSHAQQPVLPDEAHWNEVTGRDGFKFTEGWNACRAAMLQGVQPVSNRDELPFDQWLSQQNGKIDVDCCCVTTEAFFHWLRVAYESGNSPVTQDGWVACSERMPDVGDIVLTTMSGSVNVGEMERSGANYRYFTSVISGRELPATHWMPLPAAPQE